MKILKHFFPSLLVCFLFSIFFALTNSSSAYASKAVLYWSYGDAITYGNHGTFKIKITKDKNTTSKFLTTDAICIEAASESPHYNDGSGTEGTLYSDEEIRTSYPDFYKFAQKVIANYSSLPGSYGSFATAHIALSKKYSGQCNISSNECNNITNQIDAMSDATTCYELYLVTSGSQDALYVDQSATIGCPGGSKDATFSASLSKSSNVTKPAGSFDDFNVTFNGTISRGSGSSYTDNVDISYSGGDSNGSVSVGSSASVSPFATVKVKHCSSTSSSPDRTSSEVCLSEGGTLKICRTMTISPSSYSSESGGSGSASSGEKCVTVKQNNPTKAVFSGSISDVRSDDSGFIFENGKYMTYEQNGSSVPFKATWKLTRSNGSDDTHSGDASSRRRTTSTASTASDYGLGGKSSSTLAKGASTGDKTATFNVSWNLAKGACKTVTRYLYYDSEVSYSGDTGTPIKFGSDSASAQICRYDNDIVRFTGSTSMPDETIDPNLHSCSNSGNTRKCKGIAGVGTYYFNITNTVTRTSDASRVTEAKSIHKVDKNGSYTSTYTDNKVGPSKNASSTALGTKKRSRSVPESDTADQTKTYCSHVEFNSIATYYGATPALVEEPTIDKSSDKKCIEITRPKNYYHFAEFTGDIKITDNNGNVVSCTGGRSTKFGTSTKNETIECLGPTYLDDFDLTFEFILNRKNDSFPNSHASKFKASVAEGSYSSSTLDKLSPSTSSSAIAKSKSETVDKTNPSIKFTVAANTNKTYCAYFAYNSKYSYKNGDYSTPQGNLSGSSAIETSRVYKCIKIVNPDKIWNVGFSAGSSNSFTDSGYFLKESDTTDKYRKYFTSNRDADYYLKTKTNNDKYRVKFNHYVKRNDVSDYSNSEEKKAVKVAVPNNFNLKNKNSDDISEKSWTETFSITDAGIGQKRSETDDVEIYLPKGYKRKECEKVAYDKIVPFRYSTQKVEPPTTRGATSLSCIILANPTYKYKWEETSRKYVNISAKTELNSISGTTGSGTDRSIKVFEGVKVSTKHTISRGNDEFTGDNDKVSPKYTRYLKGVNTSNYSKEDSSAVSVSPSLAPGGSYSVNSGTYTVPNGSIKAGQTKSVCSYINVSPKTYHVRFGDQYIQEYYDHVDSGLKDTSSWVRYQGNEGTDRKGLRIPANETLAYANWNNATFNAPVSDNNPFDSEKYCVNLTREYNFKVEDGINPSGPASPPIPGETINLSFPIKVVKEDTSKGYITDLPTSDLAIKIIDYVVSSDKKRVDVPEADNPGSSSASSLCGAVIKNHKSGTCHENSGDTNQISHKGNSYYNQNSYSENYSLGIPVPTNLAVGEKFCVAFAIKPQSSSNSSTWVVSKSYCATVSKRPTLQVHGSSILALGKKNNDAIVTSQTKKDGKIFGSWGDFGIISKGRIRGMGSGASLAKGNSNFSEENFCDKRSPLSIANKTCIKTSENRAVGNLSELKSDRKDIVDGILKRYESFKPSGGANDNRDGNIIYHVGNYTIKNGDFTNNYSPSSDLDSIRDISQRLIIVEGNITINENVERINAWIVATGEINTCNHKPKDAGFDSETCNKQLVINGPVFAKNINFYRTYGGDANSNKINEPAELIDYNPAAILWGYENAGVDVPSITYIKELSPRY